MHTVVMRTSQGAVAFVQEKIRSRRHDRGVRAAAGGGDRRSFHGILVRLALDFVLGYYM